MTPATRRLLAACLLAVALTGRPRDAHAEDHQQGQEGQEAEPTPPDPKTTTGEIHPASSPGIGGRKILDALLFVPRELVNIAALGATATGSFLEDQQVVPRVRSALQSEDGKLHIAPTFAFATGFRPDVGARLTAHSGDFASMLRGSIVDRDTFLSEGRLMESFGERSQTQIFVEGYQQRDPRGSFAGIGAVPATDPRNVFLPGKAGQAGTYREQRERLITGVSARVAENVEVLLSTSFQRRELGDPRDVEGYTIAQVFAPGSAVGSYNRSERVYSEAAVRVDTRAVRGPPAEGILLEGYGGASRDVRGTYASAVRAGGRAGWFVSLVRSTTILNPSLTLDVVEPLGDKKLPFLEYDSAASFRGVDGRVDRVAALASLDYRWQVVSHVATRLFLDTTTVAPRITELRTDHLSWAVGLGVDVHTDTTQIGKVSVAYSPGGVIFVFVYGLADRGFGDRQHR